MRDIGLLLGVLDTDTHTGVLPPPRPGASNPITPGLVTVTPLATTDTTPTVTGTYDQTAFVGLAVTIDGVTYADTGPVLSASSGAWSLPVPFALALGTYDVAVTQTGPDDTASDATSGELAIYAPIPTPPTVTAQITADASPTIAGTYAGGFSALSVTIDGTTYADTSPQLTVGSGVWTLALAGAQVLESAVYDVAVSHTGQGLDVVTDATSGEVTIAGQGFTRPLLAGRSLSGGPVPYTFGASWTITARIRPTAIGSTAGLLLQGRDSGGGLCYFGLAPGSPDSLVMGMRAGASGSPTPRLLAYSGTDEQLYSGDSDIWITARYTGGTLTLIWGDPVSGTTSSVAISVTGTAVTVWEVGSSGGSAANAYAGAFEIALWSRAVSDAELQAIQAAGHLGAAEGDAALYPRPIVAAGVATGGAQVVDESGSYVAIDVGSAVPLVSGMPTGPALRVAVLGDSNADGRTSGTLPTPIGCHVFNDFRQSDPAIGPGQSDVPRHVDYGSVGTQGTPGAPSFGPEAGILTWAAENGRAIRIIKYGWGGSTLQDWNASRLDSFLTHVSNASEAPAAWLINLGGNDSAGTVSVATARGYLDGIGAKIWADFPAAQLYLSDMQFILDLGLEGSSRPSADEIQTAMVAFAAAESQASLITSDYVSLEADGSHYDTATQVALGRRFAALAAGAPLLVTPSLVTVDSLATLATQPTITGTYDPAALVSLAVSVDGAGYTDASAHLTLAGGIWSLDLASAGQTLAVGTYDVAVTQTGPNDSASDTTTDEVVITDSSTDADAFEFVTTGQHLTASGLSIGSEGGILALVNPTAIGSEQGGILHLTNGAGKAIFLQISPSGASDRIAALCRWSTGGANAATPDLAYPGGDAALYDGTIKLVWMRWERGSINECEVGVGDSSGGVAEAVNGDPSTGGMTAHLGNINADPQRTLSGDIQYVLMSTRPTDAQIDAAAAALSLSALEGAAASALRPVSGIDGTGSGTALTTPGSQVTDGSISWSLSSAAGTTSPRLVIL